MTCVVPRKVLIKLELQARLS